MIAGKTVSIFGKGYIRVSNLLILLLIIFLFFLPHLAGKYPMYMTMHILILSVFALGFNLFWDIQAFSPLAKRASTHAGHTVVERSLL